MLELQLKQTDHVPFEVEGITPCQLKTLPREQWAKCSMFRGKEACAVGDCFHIHGDLDDETLVFTGDLAGVHWIGAQQTSGRTLIDSNAGRHVGSNMRGGEIEVRGTAGDWLGAELHGGSIRVLGNAGDFVGAAYRGAPKGMTGGSIVVQGAAGDEIGHGMRRGLIAVGGRTGNLIGFHMLAGTIVVGGDTGIRHGANMKRGTLIFLGTAPVLLPTFQRACRSTPNVLRLLAQELKRCNFSAAEQLTSEPLELYHGDFLAGGRGEIFLRPAA
jgi:formylmethanofuran dehydrogenase subunit C